ncbi:MAG: hypothetical protein RID91_22240 [Azospirillaceae bacterium]
MDAAVARRLIALAGHGIGTPFIKGGKHQLDPKIAGYNVAARHTPWLVLRDLDNDAPCGGALVDRLVAERHPDLLLRVATREVEAWLLADREACADFLAVPVGRIPEAPEALDNPKQRLVQLAAGSRRRGVRQALVPRPGSSRQVGPEYTTEVSAFVGADWSPERAAAAAPSLARAIHRLSRL